MARAIRVSAIRSSVCVGFIFSIIGSGGGDIGGEVGGVDGEVGDDSDADEGDDGSEKGPATKGADL